MDSPSRSSVVIVGAGISGEFIPPHYSAATDSVPGLNVPESHCVCFDLKVSLRPRCWLRTASRTWWFWRRRIASAAGSARRVSAGCRWSLEPVGSPASAVRCPTPCGNSPRNSASALASPTTAMRATTSTTAGLFIFRLTTSFASRPLFLLLLTWCVELFVAAGTSFRVESLLTRTKKRWTRRFRGWGNRKKRKEKKKKQIVVMVMTVLVVIEIITNRNGLRKCKSLRVVFSRKSHFVNVLLHIINHAFNYFPFGLFCFCFFFFFLLFPFFVAHASSYASRFRTPETPVELAIDFILHDFEMAGTIRSIFHCWFTSCVRPVKKTVVIQNLLSHTQGDTVCDSETASICVSLFVSFAVDCALKLGNLGCTEVEPISTYVDFGEREFLVADERGYDYLLYKMAEEFLFTSEGRILDNRLKLNKVQHNASYNIIKPFLYENFLIRTIFRLPYLAILYWFVCLLNNYISWWKSAFVCFPALCFFPLLLLCFVVCYLISIVPLWSLQIMTSQNCFAFVFCVCICDISVTHLLPLLLASTPISSFREAFDYLIIET